MARLTEVMDYRNNGVFVKGYRIALRKKGIEQTGFTSDEGHNLFDGSWFYDYPYHANKSELNAQNFSNNLISFVPSGIEGNRCYLRIKCIFRKFLVYKLAFSVSRFE